MTFKIMANILFGLLLCFNGSQSFSIEIREILVKSAQENEESLFRKALDKFNEYEAADDSIFQINGLIAGKCVHLDSPNKVRGELLFVQKNGSGRESYLSYEGASSMEDEEYFFKVDPEEAKTMYNKLQKRVILVPDFSDEDWPDRLQRTEKKEVTQPMLIEYDNDFLDRAPVFRSAQRFAWTMYKDGYETLPIVGPIRGRIRYQAKLAQILDIATTILPNTNSEVIAIRTSCAIKEGCGNSDYPHLRHKMSAGSPTAVCWFYKTIYEYEQ